MAIIISVSPVERILLLLIRCSLFVYTLVTWPVYYLVQKPWIVRENDGRIRAVSSTRSDGSIVLRSIDKSHEIQQNVVREKIYTIEEVFNYAVRKHGRRNALGTRQILAEENEVQPNGQVYKKLVLGDYHWRTFTEFNIEAESFSRGLIELGLKVKQNIAIFSETRAEWLISANGCMKQSMPVVTLYANLGEDALVDGINETEVDCIITSQELLPKFKNILPRTPKVSIVIVFTGSLNPLDVNGYGNSVKIFPYSHVIRLGEKSNRNFCLPNSEDIAIIMFTSGSTGAPKGVLLSHRNILSAMLANTTVNTADYKDIYMAFLPLAHVLELIAESMSLLYGMAIGYSSPLTMTDKSSKIKQGCKGDATILKPTVIASVPLMLDRIYKGIQENVSNGPPFKKAIFDMALQYKLDWCKAGYDTPIINNLLFKPIRKILGGRIRYILCGGAPLSSDTHECLRAVFCCPVQQGYGLTESCAAATFLDVDDRSTGIVGGPMPCTDVKLVNWEEGNYNVNDYPNPRGEIHIGGDNIAVGYHKKPELTRSEFYEENGKRWFRTGDIGEFNPDGTIKIIDRKKDLVKLQHGEYVSLGKIESKLKTCPLVDNICVYADSTKNFVVALMLPNTETLMSIAQQICSSSLEDMCSNLMIEKLALMEIQKYCAKSRMEKFEIPQAIKLVPDIWTPDLDLVTAAFKLKRKNIQAKYQLLIDAMYAAKYSF